MERPGPELSLEVEDLEPSDMFCVELEAFEGPLHLLLDLARRNRIDLSAVSMLELAEQYLIFIRDAQAQRLDLAAGYLVMAAHLALLKSRLLLPGPADAEEAEGGDGQAARLAFRLRRLEAMRAAAGALMSGPVTGRDVFVRGAPERARILSRPVWSDTLLDLMRAFAGVSAQRARRRPHIVARPRVLTLQAARARLRTLVKESDEWRSVQSLPPPEDTPEGASQGSVLASYFAAALELARERAVDLKQDRMFDQLYVRRAGRSGEQEG